MRTGIADYSIIYAGQFYNIDENEDSVFFLHSTSRLFTPQIFSVSFNVSNGPPTRVDCTVNGVDTVSCDSGWYRIYYKSDIN